MQQLERFSALLNTVYEGATNPSSWPDILTAAAEWLDADKAIMLTPYQVPEQGGFAYWHRIEQSHVTLWATRYARENVWAHRLEEKNLLLTGNVIIGPDMLPDRELLASLWYREFLSRADIFQVLTSVVFGKDYAEYPVCMFTVFRGVCAAPFDEVQQQKMRLLVPHLSRALGVMFKLRDAEFRVAASLNALNEICTGILLLDEHGHVCFANRAVEEMFQERDGLCLKAGPRSVCKLHSEDPIAQTAIDQALRSSMLVSAKGVKHFSNATCVSRPSGLADYAVQVSYLPESNPYQLGTTIPRAIVFIKDSTKAHKPDAALLTRAYELTQAEVRLALALCDGGSLESVAQELHVSVNTLKTHLKNIYAKTSVSSRATLTRMLLSLGSH